MAPNTTDICLNINLFIFRMTENCQVGKDSWFEKFGVENRHKRSEKENTNAGYQLKHHTIAEKKKYTKKKKSVHGKAAPTQQLWTRACILNMYQFRHDNSLWRKIKAWFKHELPQWIMRHASTLRHTSSFLWLNRSTLHKKMGIHLHSRKCTESL